MTGKASLHEPGVQDCPIEDDEPALNLSHLAGQRSGDLRDLLGSWRLRRGERDRRGAVLVVSVRLQADLGGVASPGAAQLILLCCQRPAAAVGAAVAWHG
jgi:hypothetical protein